MRFVFILCMLASAHFLQAASHRVFVSQNKANAVSVYSLDDNTGTLTEIGSTQVKGNPAAMCVGDQGKRLYVALKATSAIMSMAINDDATLSILGVSHVDAGASYLSIHPSGDYLLSACYSEGQVSVHRIDDNGVLSDKPVQTLSTDERAHAIVCDPSGKFAFVPHTRPNAIHQFHFDSQSGFLKENATAKLNRKPDTGPRHLWFHPSKSFVYGSDEQGSSITAYRYNPTKGTLKVLQTQSSLPQGVTTGRNSTSDIEVHPSGKFAYIANRGHDTIAVFRIDDSNGTLQAIQHVPTEQVTRSFNVSPDGQFLVAAGQKSNRLAVFRIADDGKLTRTGTVKTGENPWWVCIAISHASNGS